MINSKDDGVLLQQYVHCITLFKYLVQKPHKYLICNLVKEMPPYPIHIFRGGREMFIEMREKVISI